MGRAGRPDPGGSRRADQGLGDGEGRGRHAARTGAVDTEAQGTDAKAEALLELIYKLQQEENDPELKVLVFTEFVPTQAMLADFLESRGFSVATLNGEHGSRSARAGAAGVLRAMSAC